MLWTSLLSVEMEQHAFQTLLLWKFFRHFPDGAPSTNYRYLRREITRNDLYKVHPCEAKLAEAECWHARLGPGGEAPHHVRHERSTLFRIRN